MPVPLSVQGSDIGLNRAFSTDLFGFAAGGIYYAGQGTVTLTGSTIHDNFAAGYGGGLGVRESAQSVSISNCKFLNNQGQNGGAIFSFTSMTIVFSEIDGNSSGTFSGGIEASGVTFTLQNSAIVNNIAQFGAGGLAILATGTGNAASSISNSTISGNIVISGTGIGGGIDAGDPTVSFRGGLNLVGVTISGNSAGSGGGIFLDGVGTSITVQNSIIAKNTAATGPDANNLAGTFTDNGGNLIGIAGTGSGNTGFTATTTQTGTTTSPLDPMVGPLQDNGGPTRTMALLAGSPALGAAVASSLTTDQRGVPRPQGPKPDVGAFELNQGATPRAGLSTNVLDFGTLEVTTSKPLTVTLNGMGDAPLTISNASVTGPDAGDFSFTPQAACTPLPVNVPGGQSCSDAVTFTPSAVGARSATLIFTDNHMNAPNSRQTVTLSGIGNGNPDFSISATPSSATVNRGSSASFTFTVTPVNGFSQAVTFACAGLPLLAQCNFVPPSLTSNGASVASTLTLSTTALNKREERRPWRAIVGLAWFWWFDRRTGSESQKTHPAGSSISGRRHAVLPGWADRVWRRWRYNEHSNQDSFAGNADWNQRRYRSQFVRWNVTYGDDHRHRELRKAPPGDVGAENALEEALMKRTLGLIALFSVVGDWPAVRVRQHLQCQ